MDENACPMCGSDCNERDELTKAEREIARLRDAIIEAATKQWEDQRRTLDSVARLRTETEEFIAIFGAQFDELARLRAENERLTGALQEIANTPTTPANHDLVAVIMLAQYALRDDAPTAPPAR